MGNGRTMLRQTSVGVVAKDRARDPDTVRNFRGWYHLLLPQFLKTLGNMPQIKWARGDVIPAGPAPLAPRYRAKSKPPTARRLWNMRKTAWRKDGCHGRCPPSPFEQRGA